MAPANLLRAGGVEGVALEFGHMADLSIPWQARFLRGLRRPDVRTAALSVARSNGKSWLAGRLAADYLRDGAPDSECVIVASSYTQATVIFRYVAAMVEDAGEDLADRSLWQYQDSTTTALIRNRSTGRAVRALGCDPRRAHGRKFGVALLDEPAQWPPGTRDGMLAAIRTGAGKVEGSKVVALGTRSDDPMHWFSEWLGGVADYAQLHAARPGDPPYQMRTIRRANPAYDYLPALREALHSQRDEARTHSTARYSYRALALNLGTADRPESVLLDPADWERCETDLPPARDGAYILAFDMGGASALTAAAGFWPATGRAEVMAVVGGVPSLAERGRADNVGSLYVRMADRGELLVSEDRRTPDVEGFIEAVIERWGVPGGIVADRYKEAELYDALNAARVPTRPVFLRGMGWREGAEDVRRFRAAVFEGKVMAPRSLLLRSALAEARVVRDTAGNEKLAKGSQSGRRALGRDDAAAALILAVAEGIRRGVPERHGLRLVAV